MTAVDQPLTVTDAAVLCGCQPPDIIRLTELGLLPAGVLSRQDVNGIRLMLSLERAGVGLPALSEAVNNGLLSMEFTRHLMPDSIVLSSRSYREVCDDLGFGFDRLKPLFIASGLPVPEADRPAREDEVRLLRLVVETLQRGASEQAVMGILRVFGQATRRIAEAMREFFREQIESRLVEQGLSKTEMMTAAARHRAPLQNTGLEALRLLSARFLEEVVFENVTMRIQDILTDHHLLEPRGNTDPAVGFVDLAGFSTLTRTIGDAEAAVQASRFEAVAQQSIAAFGGRIVKSLGDGLLLLFPQSTHAVASCLKLMHELAAARLPEIHAGLTVGPVIRRDGDIFGNSVNLAARLASLAAPSQIVVDAASLPWLDGAVAGWYAGGVVSPKGMSETAVFKLDMRSAEVGTAPRSTTPAGIGGACA